MASAKVENRSSNSFGSKRSRNDATHNDGDWTCPQCGNVNFSFRTVCNRGKCGAPRPSATLRMGSAPPNDFHHAPSYYFGHAPTPTPLPLGMSSGYPPPLSLSGMRYDYGPSASAVPYGLFVGGVGYGPGSAMDGYGYGLHGSPLPAAGRWSDGGLADNIISRKRRGGPDESSEGDWVCPKCDNINFAFRTVCNMKKCGAPRPTPASNRSKSGNKDTDAPEGSWTCSNCNNLNYPFRTVCNRKGCDNEKPAE